jgi:hypothetical protein
VTLCKDWGGVGRTLCARCEGRGRIVRVPEAPAEPPVARERGSGRARGAASALSAEIEVAPMRQPGPTLLPCPDCSGSGGLRCAHCDGVGRMLQHKQSVWSRRGETIEGQEDLPRVDEAWLRRNCTMREVYCEQQRGGFRAEWLQVPALAALIARARESENDHTRVVLSEVQINMIPVTEIVFDLGVARGALAPSSAAKPRKGLAQLDKGLYSWYIYGFENLLPQDWRFLNWDRVLWMSMLAVAVVLALLLGLALARLGGVF